MNKVFKDDTKMKLPENINLPFFTYGLFKPGQICYFRVQELVDTIMEDNIDGYLKERDGIPLLIVLQEHGQIHGYTLNFKSGKKEDAYNRIAAIEPDKVYRWGKITLNSSITANVLIGKSENKGSLDLEGVTSWDGWNDPFFNEALEEIKEILDNNQEYNIKALFRLQMAYSLLWASIERYTGLKYDLGKSPMSKIYNLKDEKSFVDSLKKNVTKIRTVCNAADVSSKAKLDPSDPRKSINYYYQVRSNSIHRGKSVHLDFDIIRSSLTELYAIFKDVLQESKYEHNQLLQRI